MRKFFVILLAAFLLTGCSSGKKTQEEPRKDHIEMMDELSITIPKEFTGITIEDPYQAFMYQKDTMFISGYSESIAELLKIYGCESISLSSYIQTFEQNMLDQGIISDTCAKLENNLWSLEYTAQVDGKDYTFLYVFYETNANFWRVQGCCPTEEFEDNREFLWDILTDVKQKKEG